MEISLQLELADWQRFQKHVERKLSISNRASINNPFISGIFWISFGALAMMLYRRIDVFHAPTAIFVSLFFILFIVLFISNLVNMKKKLSPLESGVFIGRHSFTFNEAGFIAIGKDYETKHDWSIIKKVDRGNGLILLYLDSYYAYIFPEEKLADPDAFYDYITVQHLRVHPS